MASFERVFTLTLIQRWVFRPQKLLAVEGRSDRAKHVSRDIKNTGMVVPFPTECPWPVGLRHSNSGVAAGLRVH